MQISTSLVSYTNLCQVSESDAYVLTTGLTKCDLRDTHPLSEAYTWLVTILNQVECTKYNRDHFRTPHSEREQERQV